MFPFRKVTEINTLALNYHIRLNYVIPTRQKLKKNGEKVA